VTTVILQRNVLVGRSYRLLERLGAGELGEVWKARHEGNGRECAVKFLRPSWPLEAAAVKAFLRDAKASGALRQPALVELLDQGAFGEVPYVVMPLLRGEKLERLIERHGPLPIEATLRLCEVLARGVAAAHEERVFHRRIEAANVFVHLDDKGRIVPKLMDFGIARLGQGNDQLFSPPAYVAPEQLAGDVGDGRADVWALATLIAHALLGAIPTPGDPLDPIRAEEPQLAALIADGWTLDRSKRVPMAVFARKLRDLGLRRGGNVDDFARLLAIPESIHPSMLESVRPPAMSPPKLPPLRAPSIPSVHAQVRVSKRGTTRRSRRLIVPPAIADDGQER
jgi:serine/threonine-protein kinase